jgi:hypothetical protein
MDDQRDLHLGASFMVSELGETRSYVLRALSNDGLRMHWLGQCARCKSQFDAVTGPSPSCRTLPKFCDYCPAIGGTDEG